MRPALIADVGSRNFLMPACHPSARNVLPRTCVRPGVFALSSYTYSHRTVSLALAGIGREPKQAAGSQFNVRGLHAQVDTADYQAFLALSNWNSSKVHEVFCWRPHHAHMNSVTRLSSGCSHQVKFASTAPCWLGGYFIIKPTTKPINDVKKSSKFLLSFRRSYLPKTFCAIDQ